MQPIVSVRDLYKSFTRGEESIDVLMDLSLDVMPGEFVALMGPSGSGKTTLLRILGGLEFPTAGRVLFDGADATDLTVQERRAGFVFQSYALFRHMTVFDNIAYGLRARPRRSRPQAAEIARRVTKLLELIKLPDIGARYPSQLSGGQMQRVAIARALVHEPRLVVCDEPTAALDASSGRRVMGLLRDVAMASDRSVIIVTHDNRIFDLADRILVMEDGRITHDGTDVPAHER